MFIKIGRRLVGVLRDNAEGGGGGGGTQTPQPRPQPETFSREYVHELREENKTTRLKAQEAAAALEAEKGKTTQIQQEADQRVAAATEAANKRVIKAEMKALALKEGLTDLDDLALVDIAGVKIKEDGTIEGAEDALKKFKESKPHKFGATSSSNTETPPAKPPKTDDNPKKVKDMTKEERAAEARRFGIRY